MAVITGMATGGAIKRGHRGRSKFAVQEDGERPFSLLFGFQTVWVGRNGDDRGAGLEPALHTDLWPRGNPGCRPPASLQRFMRNRWR